MIQGDIETQWILYLCNGIPDSRGLKAKCGSTYLQRERWPKRV